MTERRRARGRASEATGTDREPNQAWFEPFECPVYGPVTLQYQGNELRHIKWMSDDHGQNVFSRHYPK